MSSTFDSQPYLAVRGPSTAFTVKQLPFVTVMSRPSTASSAHNVQPQPQPQPRPASRPQSSMSLTAARGGQAFSPKWAAETKLDRSEGRASDNGGGAQRNRPTAARQAGAAAASGESAIVRDMSLENHALSAGVRSLLGMINHEKQLRMGADAQLMELERKFRELEATVKQVESDSVQGSKVWRTNTHKPQNFGPLVPSSVMDPFAEEQRITRERQQRVADRHQKQREKLELTAAMGSKSAATIMHRE
jgi:hypothetical protein